MHKRAAGCILSLFFRLTDVLIQYYFFSLNHIRLVSFFFTNISTYTAANLAVVNLAAKSSSSSSHLNSSQFSSAVNLVAPVNLPRQWWGITSKSSKKCWWIHLCMQPDAHSCLPSSWNQTILGNRRLGTLGSRISISPVDTAIRTSRLGAQYSNC
jgi:hypothetical protein